MNLVSLVMRNNYMPSNLIQWYMLSDKLHTLQLAAVTIFSNFKQRWINYHNYL